MMPFVPTLLATLIAVLGALFVLWLVATAKRDVSIIDGFWGTGFVFVAWIAQGMNGPQSTRWLILLVLVTIWGLRLSLFLVWRKWGHEEDRRYRAMRERHGGRFWWVSLWTVFGLQGVILWFVSLPLQVAAVQDATAPLGWLDAAGIGIWSVGLFFETIGDWQLARFLANPVNRGQVLDSGLWRWTRHPNYFGDFCVWWGLYLVASAGGAVATIASPILMSVLLMRVSGVSLLEQTMQDRRPAYADYQRRTSAFFPWP